MHVLKSHYNKGPKKKVHDLNGWDDMPISSYGKPMMGADPQMQKKVNTTYKMKKMSYKKY
jgi:hypothetical protein